MARVVAGDYVGAIVDFYHDDASMQENTDEPRRGRDGLVAHEEAALRRFRIRTRQKPTVLIDGDRVAINWTFDITADDGTQTRMDEVALQLWRGERIAEERFFYDPEAARRPLP